VIYPYQEVTLLYKNALHFQELILSFVVIISVLGLANIMCVNIYEYVGKRIKDNSQISPVARRRLSKEYNKLLF
jgi:hypothetical protein